MSIRHLKYLLPLVAAGIALLLVGAYDIKPEDVRFVRPDGWPKPVYNAAKNKVTTDGFKLGRKLFFDPALSHDGTVSCASCHTQVSGFTHVDHALSHGINGLKGKRNSLSLMNLAWNRSFMWDGGVNNLEVQPLAPITNPAEMDNTLAQIVKTLDTSHTYHDRFFRAFGDSAITGQRILKALAQYLVTLESFNSKYDKYMRHEPGVTMTEQELSGLTLFRKHCESCHNEPLFTNYSFQNVGLAVDTELNDMGRMAITHDFHDSLKFRVPSLRNVANSYPYMHDGRFNTLRQVLNHYTNTVVQSPSLAKEFKKPMLLTDRDKADLIAFLLTLTDKEYLYDVRYVGYRD